MKLLYDTTVCGKALIIFKNWYRRSINATNSFSVAQYCSWRYEVCGIFTYLFVGDAQGLVKNKIKLLNNDSEKFDDTKI